MNQVRPNLSFGTVKNTYTQARKALSQAPEKSAGVRIGKEKFEASVGRDGSITLLSDPKKAVQESFTILPKGKEQFDVGYQASGNLNGGPIGASLKKSMLVVEPNDKNESPLVVSQVGDEQLAMKSYTVSGQDWNIA